MKIILLGASGMLGTYIKSFFERNEYELFCPGRNLLDASKNMTEEFFAKYVRRGNIIINCIGITNKKTWNTSNAYVYAVNSAFPKELSALCSKDGIKMFHISTDCVYSGKKGNYTELDKPDSMDIYGLSKWTGEPNDCAVIRTSILGESKTDNSELLQWVISQKGEDVNGYLNHFWNGITCFRLAQILDFCITEEVYWVGAKHIFSMPMNKHDVIELINDIYDLDINLKEINADVAIDRTLSTVRYDVEFPVSNIEEDLKEQKKYSL